MFFDVDPALFGCGLLQALLAPLLAPFQNRYSGEFTRWSLLIAWGAFYFGRLWKAPDDASFLLFATVASLPGIVFASSVGEWLFGRFSRLVARTRRTLAHETNPPAK